jgi:hypothetical protein
METKNLNFVTGRISVLEETIQGKTWIKQNFLIQDSKNENRYYYFLTFKEEVIHLLSRFMVGDEIQVYFNPDSKSATSGRYYTDLIAWKIYPVNLLNHTEKLQDAE